MIHSSCPEDAVACLVDALEPSFGFAAYCLVQIGHAVGVIEQGHSLVGGAHLVVRRRDPKALGDLKRGQLLPGAAIDLGRGKVVVALAAIAAAEPVSAWQPPEAPAMLALRAMIMPMAPALHRPAIICSSLRS